MANPAEKFHIYDDSSNPVYLKIQSENENRAGIIFSEDSVTNHAIIEYDATGGGAGMCGSGCMFAGASNFDSAATLDDGSCRFAGCTDPAALDYNPRATISTACTTPVPGCTNPRAANFYAQGR